MHNLWKPANQSDSTAAMYWPVFRGNNEIIGSATNGNYLSVRELLSKFDPFLAHPIK